MQISCFVVMIMTVVRGYDKIYMLRSHANYVTLVQTKKDHNLPVQL